MKHVETYVNIALNEPLHIRLFRITEANRKHDFSDIGRAADLHRRLIHSLTSPLSARELFASDAWKQALIIENPDERIELVNHVMHNLGMKFSACVADSNEFIIHLDDRLKEISA